MESSAIPIPPPPSTSFETATAARDGRPGTAPSGARRALFKRPRVVALVLAVAAAAGGMAYLQTWPPLATVMSGSMVPTINTGDVVLLRRLHERPRVGQIVVVNVPDEARSRYGYPPVVIHRVVRVSPTGIIQTKGDARKAPDPFTVPARTVHDTVVFAVPAAGRVLAFLTSTMGLLWLAGGAFLLVVLPILETRREEHQRETASIGEIHAGLSTITSELASLRAAVEAKGSGTGTDAASVSKPAPEPASASAPEPVSESVSTSASEPASASASASVLDPTTFISASDLVLWAPDAVASVALVPMSREPVASAPVSPSIPVLVPVPAPVLHPAPAVAALPAGTQFPAMDWYELPEIVDPPDPPDFPVLGRRAREQAVEAKTKPEPSPSPPPSASPSPSPSPTGTRTVSRRTYSGGLVGSFLTRYR